MAKAMDSSSGATSSPPPSGGTRHDDRLQQGAAALAKQDYRAAIALLTSVLDEAPSPSAVRRAQVGLVKVYQRQGRWSEAIAHCQPLLSSSHGPTRDWGHQALKALQSERQKATLKESASSQSAVRRQPAVKQSAVETGFVPLPIASEASGPVPASKVQPDGGASRRADSTASAFDAGAASVEPTDLACDSDSPDDPGAEGLPAPPLVTPPPAPPKQARPEAVQKQAASKRRSPLSLPWRQAGRAQRWTPLPCASAFEQGVVSAWTLLSLVALISGLLQLLMAVGNPIRWRLMQFVLMPRWPWLEQSPTAIAAGALLVVWIASPWILQGILQLQGAKPISAERLTQLSPETGRLLKRQFLPRRLYSLPLRSPLVLSFGLHPKLSWLVVSEGLRQLSDEAIAALVAVELAHLQSWTTPCLTVAVAIAQIPYTLYWSFSAWGNRQSFPPLRGLFEVLAALCYGLFWLFRWPSLWLSRWRRWESDRLAAGLTGNPNALARALVTVSAASVAERRRDPEIGRLDGLSPLLPVDPEAALPLGVLTRQTLLEADFYALLRQRLRWPCPPRYRRWLTLNCTHPPLDERLRALMTLAARWQLEPEIPQIDAPAPDSLSLNSPGANSLGSALSFSEMLLQTAPYWGGIAGAVLALALWGVGGIAGRQSPLGWLWGDRAILQGLTVIGVSMGLLARVNRYFPDIPSAAGRADLASLLGTRGAPVQAVPVVFQGKLIGGHGLKNALSQDLLLDTSDGLIRLAYTSALGPGGNLFLGQSPAALLGRTVTVTGRFHRGATAWVDVDRIGLTSSPAGRTCSANHPIWSILVAFGLALWGAWTIYQGGA